MRCSMWLALLPAVAANAAACLPTDGEACPTSSHTEELALFQLHAAQKMSVAGVEGASTLPGGKSSAAAEGLAQRAPGRRHLTKAVIADPHFERHAGVLTHFPETAADLRPSAAMRRLDGTASLDQIAEKAGPAPAVEELEASKPSDQPAEKADPAPAVEELDASKPSDQTAEKADPAPAVEELVAPKPADQAGEKLAFVVEEKERALRELEARLRDLSALELQGRLRALNAGQADTAELRSAAGMSQELHQAVLDKKAAAIELELQLRELSAQRGGLQEATPATAAA